MEEIVNSMEGNNREKLFAIITATSFVMDDLRLFLDTHPTDGAALDYWDKVRELEIAPKKKESRHEIIIRIFV